MSLATWKATFYPVDAAEVSKADAVAHSLRKWEGLRKENLERHRGRVSLKYLHFEDGAFRIASDTCALCVHYDKPLDCPGCPLYESQGKKRCDNLVEFRSPFAAFCRDANPEPMIAALLAAQKSEQAKSEVTK